ncbi:YcaO-like family protein [Kribbella sp. NPDC048928]|uniref:YcaO-like family protein n=1 Tax=Kribbella sp. NPDC048928 TaxID=3364111 RepID=UPI0037132940
MSSIDTKLRLAGTHRLKRPDATWSTISAYFDQVGITRVADVTHLDCIGVPVCMAIRPDSETLAVSQGKGATLELAKISAAMESIELWHAERPRPAPFTAPVETLELPYRITDLPLRPDARIGRTGAPLNWVTGLGIVNGKQIPVPLDMVGLSLSSGHDWKPAAFMQSSNGLASGNTVAEAALHGLYELIERHTTSSLRDGSLDNRRTIRPESVPAGHCRELLAALSAADVRTELSAVPNEFGVPCHVCFIWSPEYPVVCAGAGCHSDPLVSLSRAVTEAVQTRLTGIAGTRDDIPSSNDALQVGVASPTFDAGDLDWDECLDALSFDHARIGEELLAVADQVAEVNGFEPIVVDLSSTTDFAVVRVVCPGLLYTNRHHLPR